MYVRYKSVGGGGHALAEGAPPRYQVGGGGQVPDAGRPDDGALTRSVRLLAPRLRAPPLLEGGKPRHAQSPERWLWRGKPQVVMWRGR